MATKKRATRTASRSKVTAAEENPTRPAPATAPAGDQDSAAEKVHRALRENPGSTAAQIALAAGIGGSTTRKALATLALQGQASREQSGGRRVADRWHPVESTLDTAPAQDADQGKGEEPTTATVPEPSSEDTTEDTTGGATPDADAPSSGDGAVPPASATTTPRGDSETVPGPQKRLAPGALRGQVEDWLRDHPNQEFGPTEIGRKLVRSSGAVANALDKLVADGVAVRTSDKPKRYQLHKDQQSA